MKNMGLWRKGFDLGLISESEQLRTSMQMRELVVKQHLKNLKEIDVWIENQMSNLNRLIAKKEEG